MKKLFTFVLLIFALSGVAFAANSSKPSIKPVDCGIILKKKIAVQKIALVQEEQAPHLYVFLTTCGPWLMTTEGTRDLTPLAYDLLQSTILYIHLI